ncbi:MAG: sugar ABC transporter substrate-binding protein [Sphaerochaetaceae bacterium]|nr:sugar ABC transporter substrate-binding protein [Sphaerochaetaceae bacterium]
MRKRVGVFAIVMIICMFVTLLPVAAQGGAEKKEQLTIGVVIPYQIGWFAAFHQGFSVVAENENVKLVWQFHEYSPDKETTAIQNLITMGVDAINVTSATPESAEYSCRLANEAGIPIQVTESGVAPGAGKPFADIDFNWYETYQQVAKELRAAESGDLNVLFLQGFLGSPPVMQGIKGFEDAVAVTPGLSLAAPPQDGQYATEPSLNITKGMVQGGLKFNVAVGASQEITEGIIQGLKEEKVNLDDVVIISVNGGPQDVVNLQDGEMDYCVSQPVGVHGMICAQNLINSMTGRTYQTKTYSPIVWTTRDNWKEQLIPWEMDASWLPLVDEFVRTGKYNASLRP